MILEAIRSCPRLLGKENLITKGISESLSGMIFPSQLHS